VFDREGHRAFGNCGSKGVLEPCIFKSRIGSNTFNSSYQKCQAERNCSVHSEIFRRKLSLHSICWLLKHR